MLTLCFRLLHLYTLTEMMGVLSSLKVLYVVAIICTSIGLNCKISTALRFNKDGEFKILQVADMHYANGQKTPCEDVLPNQIKGCSDLNTTVFIKRMIKVEKPDFIVFTGDNIFGSDATDAAKSMDAAFAPAVESNIPWAAVLGNHDQESKLLREGVMKYVVRMNNTLSMLNPAGVQEIAGFGNYNLEVVGVHGSPFQNNSILNLYFLDSGDYSKDPNISGYDWIKSSQISWFLGTSKALKSALQESQQVSAPGLVYFHIPLPEFAAFSKSKITGVQQEGISSPAINSGFFDSLVGVGDVRAVFVGHDHINDFCGLRKHIYLCYAGGFGYHAYGKAGWSRMARVVSVKLEKVAKRVWGPVKSIETWKRLDDANLTTIDAQVLWSKTTAGDNIFGSDATDAAKTMDAAFAPAVESNIPWAAVLGNHDQESKLLREGVMKYVVRMNNTLSMLNPAGVQEIAGFGNYNLEVVGVHGSPFQNNSILNLYFLDSGDYSKDPNISGYDWIKSSQISWFLGTSEALKSALQESQQVSAPGLVYFHIPLPEFAAFSKSKITGVQQEGISSPAINSGFFDSLVGVGDVRAVFVGHDHINDFCGLRKHIYLCYAGGFGYHAYGKAGWSRMARVVSVKLEKVAKRVWGPVKSIETWKRLDDANLTTIDAQVLWSKTTAGDNIFGSDATDAAKTMDAAFAPAVESNIPWAAVLGNHDQESKLLREGVMKYVVRMNNTLSMLNPAGVQEIAGFGNYNLEVVGVHGSPFQNNSILNLYFLDSGDYSKDPNISGYDWIKSSQISWFLGTSEALKSALQESQQVSAPGLVYFHIPLPEFAAFSKSKITGVQQEGISSPAINSGFFDSLVGVGDVRAVFVGHDHINDFCGLRKHIYLCYAGGFGYHAYGKAGWSRMARVVSVKLEKVAKRVWGPVKSSVLMMQTLLPLMLRSFGAKQLLVSYSKLHENVFVSNGSYLCRLYALN